MLPKFDYIRPGSLKKTLEHLSSDGAVPHAGGTDLMGCLREGIFEVRKVVSLSGVRELRGVQETTDGGLTIGALTTITEVSEDPLIRDRYPALSQAASEVASPQLRNQGTIGGNLCQKPRCWYYRGEFDCLRKKGDNCFAFAGENQFHCILGGDGCYIVHPSDTAPALVALNAVLRVAGPSGERRVGVEDFHVSPARDPKRETVLERNEILREVILPPPLTGQKSVYRKVRARRSWDFALAGLALALQLEGDRVLSARAVLSGAAPVPWRTRAVEEAITGKRLLSAVREEAAEAAVSDAEPLDQNQYKIPLFKGLINEELEKIAKA
jgi:xanthine dehydrogenase YagS FAD-binding subunit